MRVLQRLGEEISKVVGGPHVWDHKFHILNAFAEKEMTALDMFGAIVVLWVVGQIDRAFVVELQCSNVRIADPEFFEEARHVKCFFASVGAGDRESGSLGISWKNYAN